MKSDFQKLKSDLDQCTSEKIEAKNDLLRLKRDLDSTGASHEQRMRELELERKKTDDIVSGPIEIYFSLFIFVTISIYYIIIFI